MAHSKDCVCKGTSKIPQQTSERLPGGTIISGVEDVDCPYGYLRVNVMKEAAENAGYSNPLENFEF